MINKQKTYSLLKESINKKVKFEMTGSPKKFGFDTKEQFVEKLNPKMVEHTNIKNADVLVVGDWNPNVIKKHGGSKKSNKAYYAEKNGIKIMNYKEFMKKYGKSLNESNEKLNEYNYNNNDNDDDDGELYDEYFDSEDYQEKIENNNKEKKHRYNYTDNSDSWLFDD